MQERQNQKACEQCWEANSKLNKPLPYNPT